MKKRPILFSGEAGINNGVEWQWFNKKLPSIHMPRWASRLTLEITSVMVERLQEITEEDAKKEGVVRSGKNDDCSCHLSNLNYECDYKEYRRSFCILWDSINGKKYPWASNPWVWVIEFKRVKQ